MTLRLFVLATLCLVTGVPAGAQTPNQNPTFELSTGLLWGQADELVLRDGTYDSPVSRLVWDVPTALTLKATFAWPWSNSTSTRGEVQTALPMTTGVILDEDWNTGTSLDDLVYGRSTSTAILKSRWDGRVEETLSWGGVRLLGGGRFVHTAWEARGGEYDYSYVGQTSQHAQRETGLLPLVTTLTYEQTWLIPYLGVEGTWAERGSAVTLTLRGFPWAYCYDVDNHPLRDIKFTDIVQGGWYGQGSVEVALLDSWQWGFRLSGEIAYGAVGDTFQTDSSGTTKFRNSAGAWFREVSIAAFVRN